jgi:hypothetical protein
MTASWTTYGCTFVKGAGVYRISLGFQLIPAVRVRILLPHARNLELTHFALTLSFSSSSSSAAISGPFYLEGSSCDDD